MIQVQVLADSRNAATLDRITTFLLTYPRFIHSEFLTHRMLSRNSASSRAIPISKMLEGIYANPALPVSWGKNAKGMQAHEELPKHKQVLAEAVWRLGRYPAIATSWALSKLGVHKQVANRVTEPWAHMTVVATATDWQNFFALRAHPDAQPEFQELAYQMLEAYRSSTPYGLEPGQWHLPFIRGFEREKYDTTSLLKIATARCARTSYVNFYGRDNREDDYRLHDDLVKAGHWSPFEHPALAMNEYAVEMDTLGNGRLLQANFHGYMPYRKTFKGENRTQTNTDVDLMLYERDLRRQKRSLGVGA